MTRLLLLRQCGSECGYGVNSAAIVLKMLAVCGTFSLKNR